MVGPWEWLAWAWGVAAVVFAGVWWVCHRIGNAGYVDVAWAFGIMLGVVLAAFMICEFESGRAILVFVIGGLWALRLSRHLYQRIHGKEEDGRYAHMRKSFGAKAPLAFFVFFQMQAFFVVLFLAPMVSAMTRPGPLDWRDALGLGIWLVALGGEWLADKQLADFKRDPANAGGVCKRGLWRYSRHPNYFFEWLHWFAWAVMAVGSPNAWVALAGPVVVYLFLVRLSGIPWVEQQALRTRGDAYARYQETTSPFFLRPPREAVNMAEPAR